MKNELILTMGQLLGDIKFVGTVRQICFYKVEGVYYARKQSSLTAHRIQTDPKFVLTRVYAGLMGQASKIASSIYKALPKNFRQFWMFKAFAGEAFQLLKAGTHPDQTKQLLWQTYITVWEEKLSQNRSTFVRRPSIKNLSLSQPKPAA